MASRWRRCSAMRRWSPPPGVLAGGDALPRQRAAAAAGGPSHRSRPWCSACAARCARATATCWCSCPAPARSGACRSGSRRRGAGAAALRRTGAAEQDAALQPDPGGARRVILATNVAETSVTIPGIRVVVDSGLVAPVAVRPGDRHEPARDPAGVARLGRPATGTGGARGRGRLLPAVGRGAHRSLAAFTAPEIVDADLAPLALELASWGTRDATSLAWLEPPPAPTLAARARCCSDSAPGRDGRLSAHGRELARCRRIRGSRHCCWRRAAGGLAGSVLSWRRCFRSRPAARGPGAPRDADILTRLELLRGEWAGGATADRGGLAGRAAASSSSGASRPRRAFDATGGNSARGDAPALTAAAPAAVVVAAALATCRPTSAPCWPCAYRRIGRSRGADGRFALSNGAAPCSPTSTGWRAANSSWRSSSTTVTASADPARRRPRPRGARRRPGRAHRAPGRGAVVGARRGRGSRAASNGSTPWCSPRSRSIRRRASWPRRDARRAARARNERAALGRRVPQPAGAGRAGARRALPGTLDWPASTTPRCSSRSTTGSCPGSTASPAARSSPGAARRGAARTPRLRAPAPPRRLAADAPHRPTGSRIRIDYLDDLAPCASMRMQEVSGSPRRRGSVAAPSRSPSSCSHLPSARCRSPAISPASGATAMSRCARTCGGDIRGTTGPRIRSRPNLDAACAGRPDRGTLAAAHGTGRPGGAAGPRPVPIVAGDADGRC